MSEQFDPYRKWLGIPPKDQPPNHYRLLGIPLFEDDLDVIENAADRQMAHVRTYQSSQHATASQQILNELAAAKLCLLTPGERATYDKRLKAEIEPEPAGPPTPPAPLPPVPMGLPPGAASGNVSAPATPAAPGAPAPPNLGPAVGIGQSVTSGPKAKTASIPITGVSTGGGSGRVRPRSKKSPVPLFIIGGAAVVLLLALIGVFAALSTDSPPNDDGDRTADADRGSPDMTPKFDPDWERDRPGGGPYRGAGPRNGNDRRRPPRGARNQDPPDTDFGLPPLIPGDDTGELPDFNPGSFQGPTGAEQVRQSLTDVRQALASRDIRLARRHIDDAERSQISPVHEEQVDQARVVLMYYEGFSQAAQRGARQIKPGAQFSLGGRDVTMVQTKGDTITYNDGTADQKIQLSELAQEDAVALARRVFDPDDATAKLQLAAFLALDEGGDRDANLTAAKRLWREAADGGLRNAALAQELGIYDDVAVNPPSEHGDPDFEPPPFAESGASADDSGAPPAADTAARSPVPAAEDLRLARTRASRAYRAQFSAARLPAQQSAVAQEVYKAALSETDKTYRYALLELARDSAVKLAVPEALVGIVDEMADDYDIDPLSEKATYLVKSVAQAATPKQVKDIFDYAGKLTDEALDENNYEAATGLADAAIRAARKSKNVSALKLAEEKQQRVEQVRDAQKEAAEAKQIVEADPEDPGSNETLGRYLCFYEEKWSEGLPHLAKSDDLELHQLATAELDQPRAAAEQTGIADAWFDLGEKTGGRAGDAMRRRALQRYRHIAPFLRGDEKSRVDGRIKQLGDEFDKQPPPAPAPKDPAPEDAEEAPGGEAAQAAAGDG
jgi:hypothetical protein